MTGAGNVAHEEELDVYVNGKNVALLSGDGWEYEIADRTVNITSPGSYTLSGTNTEGKVAFYIRPGAGEINLTLDGLNLSGYSKETPYSPIQISDIWQVDTVNITLVSANSLKADVPDNSYSRHYGGIVVPNNRSISIGGPGSLYVMSKTGAAIGGREESSLYGIKHYCGNISITGGRIVAVSEGYASAAIGSSNDGNCGEIRISGGTIAATASRGQAIGKGGSYGNSTTITITGGSVKTTDGGTATKAADESNNSLVCVEVGDLEPDALVELKGLDGYGTDGIYADSEGKIYLWLKEGDYLLAAGGKSYNAAVSGSGATVTIIEEPATPKLTISSVVIDGGKIMLSIDGGQVAATRSAKKAAASDGIIKVRVATGLPMTDGNSRSVEPTLTDNGDGTVTATFEVEKPESGAMFFKVER